MLFTGIGIDKIQAVTYSANVISDLFDNQIQDIINDFKKANASEAVSAEVRISIASISLAHVSAEGTKGNSSDNSKEDAWFDKDIFFNEVNSSKVNTVTSDDNMYFDETNDANADDSNPNSINDDFDFDDSEEMPDDSDDDGYNRYNGYNEYGECDRGYYYHDGRYERKVSLMMSPIISSVII